MKNRLNLMIPIIGLIVLHYPSIAQVSLTIGSTDTLVVNGNMTIALSGNWENKGSFMSGSGTVSFNGSGDQTITSDGDESFYNLLIANSGGELILNSTVTITNDLNLANGQVNNSQFPLILGDAATFTEGAGTLQQPPVTYGQLTLWPPNHKYEKVYLSSFFSESAVITSVTSDEPEDAPGNGDGKTLDDIVISDDCQWVKLRKERQGKGNGRGYTVFVLLEDGSASLFRVIVPHDQGNSTVALDATAYTVTGNCNTNKTSTAGEQLSSLEKESELTLSNLPDNFSLAQNYPNPFNPNTTILYQLPSPAHVKLRVFNSLGQLVANLINVEMKAGYHQVLFNAQYLSSGVYYYSIQAGSFKQIRKMILMK